MIMNVLVVGAQGAGKSLLVKRLQSIFTQGINVPFDDAPSTIPTVGNNITKVTIGKFEIELREVGGAMAPLWKNYYSDAYCVIYVVDQSNQFQMSASCMLLLTLLSNEKLKNKKVLIVFNKRDFSCDLSMTQIKDIFRLDEIMSSASQDIDFVECSCISKTGFEKITNWLSETLKLMVGSDLEKR